MYNKDGVYNLFRELREFIKKPTPSKYKKMLTNSFEWYTQHYYTGTPHWADGAITFIPLSNDLNSGQISLIAVCSAFIGNWILKNKLLTYKEVNEVDKIREIAKFYSVLETRKHFQYIEELEENSVDASDAFAEFTQNKINVYQVNAEQKNMLYDLVKDGKVNFFCYVFALMKGKFTVDENKITDPDFKLFYQCMNIVRQNITKK